jgi:hypothetical protein
VADADGPIHDPSDPLVERDVLVGWREREARRAARRVLRLHPRASARLADPLGRPPGFVASPEPHMKRFTTNVLFWMLFSFVCAMWVASTACPNDDVFCLVKE